MQRHTSHRDELRLRPGVAVLDEGHPQVAVAAVLQPVQQLARQVGHEPLPPRVRHGAFDDEHRVAPVATPGEQQPRHLHRPQPPAGGADEVGEVGHDEHEGERPPVLLHPQQQLLVEQVRQPVRRGRELVGLDRCVVAQLGEGGVEHLAQDRELLVEPSPVAPAQPHPLRQRRARKGVVGIEPPHVAADPGGSLPDPLEAQRLPVLRVVARIPRPVQEARVLPPRRDHAADLVGQQRHRPEQPGAPPLPGRGLGVLHQRRERGRPGELGGPHEQGRLAQLRVHPAIGMQCGPAGDVVPRVAHEEELHRAVGAVRAAAGPPGAHGAVPQGHAVGRPRRAPGRHPQEVAQVGPGADRLHPEGWHAFLGTKPLGGHRGITRGRARGRDGERRIPRPRPTHHRRPLLLPTHRREPLDVTHLAVLGPPHPVAVTVRVGVVDLRGARALPDDDPHRPKRRLGAGGIGIPGHDPGPAHSGAQPLPSHRARPRQRPCDRAQPPGPGPAPRTGLHREHHRRLRQRGRGAEVTRAHRAPARRPEGRPRPRR